MAKLKVYREYVQRVLQEYSQYRPAYGDVTMQLLFDTERDHYQLLSVG